MQNKTVVVGMSGGVDSSVAAWLLKEQGYHVIGLFMKNWEEQDENGVCTSEADFADVRDVCASLDIPYYTVNFAREYYEHVFTYFLEQYRRGLTPNPDVLCNREIKFGPFLRYALSLGADFIATGHYAGIEHKEQGHLLLRARDLNKDQSYFLHQLSQSQLERVLFPLAGLEKPQVRKIAEKLGLSTAKKKDSTGICFIGERNFRKFLSTYLPAQEGDIVTADGTVVGRHMGVMYYTVGQRKGLNIGGVKGGEGRWFVVEKDVARNRLIVRQNEGEELLSCGLTCTGVNWIPDRPDEREFSCTAKFRYRQPDQEVLITQTESGFEASFAGPQRAVTPGQYCVLYRGERCLGGGEIVSVVKSREKCR